MRKEGRVRLDEDAGRRLSREDKQAALAASPICRTAVYKRRELLGIRFKRDSITHQQQFLLSTHQPNMSVLHHGSTSTHQMTLIHLSVWISWGTLHVPPAPSRISTSLANLASSPALSPPSM